MKVLLLSLLSALVATVATEPGVARQMSNVPSSVMNGETYLYTDISLVNTTDSLDRIMKLDLVHYTFLHDSVEGRKQVGILPRDALRLFPESVDIVESYTFPNKDRKAQPIVVSALFSSCSNLCEQIGSPHDLPNP